MSVNLSAAQLQDPELSTMVADFLATSRLDPGALCLEITETVALESIARRPPRWMHCASSASARRSTTFGTGYSSLDYLRRFRMHVLKIDRSLVQGLDRDREAAALTTAAVRIAEALGLVAVAEGVETAGEPRALLALGCHFAQGYHFARPLPLDAVHALLVGRQTAVLTAT